MQPLTAVPTTAVRLGLAPDGSLSLHCAFTDREAAKSVAGWSWRASSKTWRYPANIDTLGGLRQAFAGRLLVAPAVLELLRGASERAEQLAELRGQAEIEGSWPVTLPLYLHQRRAAAMAVAAPTFANLMEMGTGKTAATIAALGRRFLDGSIQRALIVCPKSVQPVWASEFQRFAAFPFEVATLEGPVEQRIAALRGPWPEGLAVATINYEATWRMEAELKAFCQGQALVADELQRAKTPGAKQSKALHRLGKAAAWRIGLTGTPVTQSPLDLYSEYKFLDPAIFGGSFTAFKSRYAVMGGFDGREVVGYQHLDELVRKAHSIGYRVTRAECLDLPPESVQEIPITLGPHSRSLYDSIKKDAVARLGEAGIITAANVLVEILRLQQIAGGFVGTDDGGPALPVGTEKLDACCDLIGDLLADARRKVVVFCRFRPEIAALEAALAKGGIVAGVLSGGTGDRGAVVATFQEQDRPRVLIAQIQTGGLGITLHRADTAVFYSTGWSLGDYEQAKARIQRAGQTAGRVLYVHLTAGGTVDEQIMAALREKRDLALTITEGWREVLA